MEWIQFNEVRTCDELSPPERCWQYLQSKLDGISTWENLKIVLTQVSCYNSFLIDSINLNPIYKCAHNYRAFCDMELNLRECYWKRVYAQVFLTCDLFSLNVGLSLVLFSSLNLWSYSLVLIPSLIL